MKTLLLLGLILQTSCKIPSTFKKCNRSQVNFKNCLIEAVQDALPQLNHAQKELNLPSLAPLEVSEISIEVGKEKVAFSQKLKNCKLYGYDKGVVKNVDFNFEKKTLKLEGVMSEVKTVCEYEVDGRLMVFPIRGKGLSTTVSTNFDMSINTTFTETHINGKTYLHFTNTTTDATNDRIYFQIDNLFNGNKELGDKMNEILNENWEDLYSEVKTYYMRSGSQLFETLLNRVFSKISLEEAFDD